MATPEISKVLQNKRLILFDGVCKLCHGWSQFVIKHDNERKFTLCSIQSDIGKEILLHFGYDSEQVTTMLYVEHDQCWAFSDAFLAIIRQFSWPWKALYLFAVIPQFIRDPLYRWIATHRYQWFGKYDYCLMPNADHDSRFLD